MNLNKQQVWAIVGGAILLMVTFALGYWVGNNSQKHSIEPVNSLSSTDMEHAFGGTKLSIHEPKAKEPAAQSLSGLVAGLEKKVAANPENVDQQLLLAQTYNELDNRDKSLKLLRSLINKFPKNAQVKVTLATILMKGEDKQELKDASQLFDEAIQLKPDVASMARMYQKEIRSRLGNASKQ